MAAWPTTLSILIIDENRLRASVIEAGLRDAGYTDLTVVHDVVGIARRIADIEPDVIVISLENPNRDMLENMFQLSRAVQRPIAMFVDRSDQAAIEAAVEAGVSAYVVDLVRIFSSTRRALSDRVSICRSSPAGTHPLRCSSKPPPIMPNCSPCRDLAIHTLASLALSRKAR